MIKKRRIEHFTATCDSCGATLEEAFYVPTEENAASTWETFTRSRRSKGWQDKKEGEEWRHYCYICSDYRKSARRYDTLKNEVRDLDLEFDRAMVK